MKKITRTCLVSFVAASVAAAPLLAQNTTVRVRVVAHDAKIIGDEVGGALVTIRDASSGQVLAQGEQGGSTGDTRAIVMNPRVRGHSVFDTRGAGYFEAQLDLAGPTVLEITGEGPLGYEQARQRASMTLVVSPGEDLVGDGVILELHGFIVEADVIGDLRAGGDAVRIRARVRMMCGCPLTPGGLWDADRVIVTARVTTGDRLVREVQLAFAGEPNTYTAPFDPAGLPSDSEITILAADPARHNLGLSNPLAVE